MKQFFNTVTLPYITYLMYFLGVGFLSGAIVHYPVNPSLYGVIGAAGAIIFTIASILNEWVTNKRHLLQEGVLKIVLYSLILSIGLGMISGGIQHFVDFPIYASYLVPAGFVISLLGYILNKEIKLDAQHKLILVAKLAIIAIPLFLILNFYAKGMTQAEHNDGHGSETKTEKTTNVPVQQGIEHRMEIKDDKDFIMGMIPHHQEAVDVSEIIVKRSKNSEVKKTAQEIVNVQKKEIAMLQGWLKDWYGEDYTENSEYKAMMATDYQAFPVEDIDAQYYSEMIAHHEGAIDMAKQIQSKTERTEIKEFTDAVIDTQSKEVDMMKKFLDEYAPAAVIEDVEHSDGNNH